MESVSYSPRVVSPFIHMRIGNGMVRIHAVLFVSGLLWVLCVVGGTWTVLQYTNSAGTAGSTPGHWPTNSQVAHDSERTTLSMFVHPQCPCSRASIGELAVLMAQCQQRVTAHVLVMSPREFTKEWAQSDLWRSAAAIPGVDVRLDEDGLEARRFGAETSGYTVLYDAKGKLLFHGGITSARGHSGDNAGRDAIIALIRRETVAPAQTRVFGCPLSNRNLAECGRETVCSK